MSEAKLPFLERIVENVESDTDNENDNKINKKRNNETNIIKNNNAKGNAVIFNQSNQNFAKFSQMAKNNDNKSSFSDQSKSRDEISNEKDNNVNSDISDDKVKKITENKNKSESLSASDYNNDINNKFDYEMDSNLYKNDKSRENFKYNKRNLNIIEREKQIMQLNFFDVNQFLNLDLDEEYKSLLTIMKKFEIDKTILTLDTKMKPYIPNLIPSIGEVDAFIKINRPDNKIEELGLDIVDEPTINGIDPSVFCLELSYKMKTKKPENFIIKSIDNAQKNPKQITNWIENLENMHKGANKNVTYTKKMPEIEQLMQVLMKF